MIKEMNITSAQYRNDDNGNPSSIQAQIDGKSMSVPLDPGNRHYAEIMRQVDAGELVVEPDPGISVEQARESASLSRADFKLGLLDMGELDAVKAVMADPETPERVVIMWEDSARFNRMHPDLLSFAQVMGYTESQLDHLFGVESGGVNINTATAEELESLSGVGASLAQQIIDGRPWNSVNDLDNISGISEDMVSSWFVTV